MPAMAPATRSRCRAENSGLCTASVSTRATAMTLVASGRSKGCSRGRTSISPECSRIVRARNATPVSFGLMKRKSVGRSHAQSITRGIRSSRVALALLPFITERTFAIPKATEATIIAAPVPNRISFFDSACFMRRNGRRQVYINNQAKEIELTGAGKIFSLAENFLDRLDRPVLTWCPSNVANRGTIGFDPLRQNWITIHETHEATLRGFWFRMISCDFVDRIAVPACGPQLCPQSRFRGFPSSAILSKLNGHSFLLLS